MSKKTLRAELAILEKHFPQDEGSFQIVRANPEELVCCFVDSAGHKYTIQCSISPSYPVVLPVWYTEANGASSGASHPLLAKVQLVCKRLCTVLNTPVPKVIAELFSLASSMEVDESDSDEMQHDFGSGEEDEGEEGGDEEEEEEDYGDDEMFVEDLDLQQSDQEDIGGDSGITDEHKAILEKVRLNTRQDYLQGATSGSVRATDRLMRELQDIYRSKNFKDGLYTVELIDDCLYSWNIKLFRVDSDSPLMEDIKKLKETDGQDHILLHVVFDDKFPYSPPFIRVVKPVLSGGYVLAGGAICMELLTPQGWSSAYTLEAVVMQISATLVKGKARIAFTQTKGESYTLSKAQHAYKSLVKIHEKSGWFTPPKEEG
ncbi:Ubiquitin-conjugating enzyme E2 Q1 [Geodia barretti]|uniref:E2 ubiquitin-conjugating enzyme n=1 Tax=Geodia barretti TaxID=519541 RepID=A0AA35RNA7_GEOBA|nr:Ubiquitin-conjugating enzyme E2 Q1 [Geodia barretti]